MARRKKYGMSFSWKRATGLSAAKGKLSRQLGIPLTRSGRQRKAGKAMGCCIPVALLLLLFVCIAGTLAQTKVEKRKVAVSLSEGDPISGYLIRTDADTIEIEKQDGSHVIVPLDNVTMIIVARKSAVESSPTSNTNSTVDRFKRQIEKMEAKVSEIEQQQQSETQKLEKLARAQEEADSYREQLRDVQAKEAELQSRMEQLDYDLKPENIKRATIVPSGRKKEDAREERRRQLQDEQSRLKSQLDLLVTERSKLEESIQAADLVVARLSEEQRSQPSINTSLTPPR